ncbi:hypothetical protein, partial [Pseudorhodobacter sp.]|uniref:hypothetical protein n=1 Tax=Pseudorhodobacter sp. TaxID=1934400 RepID=UPI002647285A
MSYSDEFIAKHGSPGESLTPSPHLLDDPLADLLADAEPTVAEVDDDPLAGLLDNPDIDPLAALLADSEPTPDDISSEVAKTGIGGLLPKREGDALADLL